MITIPTILAVVSFVIATWIGLWTWAKQREFKEREFSYKLKLQEVENKYKELLLLQKHASDNEKIEDRLTRLSGKVDEINTRGSERYGRLQGQLTSFELDLRKFMSEYQAKMEELFRLVHGRRASDLEN